MCDERERLLDYLYDACGAEERRTVEQHLAACEGCREEISSLRGVRLSLLAWDVPEHESVWKPFAPARLRPWYREVPAWALAAAASVMFGLGMAGGFVARALVPVAATASTAPSAPQAAPVVTPMVTVTPTNAQLHALEQRVLETARAQTNDILRRVVAESEARQRAAVTAALRANNREWLKDSDGVYATKSELSSAFEGINPNVRTAAYRPNGQ